MDKQEILLESGTNEMEILTFILGGQVFGVNVAKVQSIVPYDEKLVTRMPEAQEAMEGMLLYRQRTIPLIDLKRALQVRSSGDGPGTDADNGPGEGASDREVIIVTEFNNTTNSFKVDGVNRIHRLSWKDFVPMGDFLSRSGAGIIGSINIEDSEILIVDMEMILSTIIPDLAFEEASDETLAAAGKKDREDIRIFFAEDSVIIRKNVIRILADTGYKAVTAFDNGQAAWKALTAPDAREQQPHIIISDIEMPGMDGLTLCRRIKADVAGEEIPVVMFSSLINDQMITKCNAVGADGYVTKPEMNKLVAILDELCLQ